MDNDHGRKLSIWKEQARISKIRRTLENKKKQGNQEHIAGGRYCKIYKIPPISYGHVERTKNQKWQRATGKKGEKNEETNRLEIKKDNKQWSKTIANSETFYWKPRSSIAAL